MGEKAARWKFCYATESQKKMEIHPVLQLEEGLVTQGVVCGGAW